MLSLDLFNAIPETSNKPTPGTYPCRIDSVIDYPDDCYIEIEYDITAGEFKGYAAETNNRAGFWPLHCRCYYTGKSGFYFKKFVRALEASNPGFTWNGRAAEFNNKYVGIILEERPYTFEGQQKKSLSVKKFIPFAEARNQALAPRKTEPVFQEVEEDDEEIPF